MKFRTSSIAAVLLLGVASLPFAHATEAPAAAPAAKPAYSTAETDIGTLLENAQTRAVIDKHILAFASNPQVDMARAMTLRQIQSFASDVLTDEVLGKIDADLAKVPKAG